MLDMLHGQILYALIRVLGITRRTLARGHLKVLRNFLNLHQSFACTYIEGTFYSLKGRFKILSSRYFFSFKRQMEVAFVWCVLQHWWWWGWIYTIWAWLDSTTAITYNNEGIKKRSIRVGYSSWSNCSWNIGGQVIIFKVNFHKLFCYNMLTFPCVFLLLLCNKHYQAYMCNHCSTFSYCFLANYIKIFLVLAQI